MMNRMDAIEQWETITYSSVLAGNVRAARARAGIDQKTLGRRMAVLGYGAWAHYQTVSKVEKSRRPLSAEEVMGLCLCLDVPVAEMMAPAATDRIVKLPDGAQVGSEIMRKLAYGIGGRAIHWFDTDTGTSYVLGAGGGGGSASTPSSAAANLSGEGTMS
jgi:transcriptional regulator with XRE-family HTH domain